MNDDWTSFEDGFSRHLHNLGFVPPEFQRVQKFDLDGDPQAVKLTDISGAMSPREWQSIEEAGTLAHRNAISYAEAARTRGGYGGLGADVKVPDQRHLLTDNDPLD